MSLSFDPEFAQVFAAMAEAMSGATHPPVGDVAARRAMWEPIIGAASAAQPVPADVTTTEYYATADDGTKITMRWYAKTDAPAGPAALFFHGGGYIFGHIDLFDGAVARYVSASGVPMLSVEYRRAPEHPFPTPVEDAYTALRWLHQHAEDLGVDPARIGVMGDSAGGGLAAALLDAIDPLGIAYLHLIQGRDDEFLQRIRRQWSTALIVNRGGTPLGTRFADLDSGLADVVSVGATALANPDLPHRLRTGALLNEPDPATFHGGNHRGYTDYPTLPITITTNTES